MFKSKCVTAKINANVPHNESSNTYVCDFYCCPRKPEAVWIATIWQPQTFPSNKKTNSWRRQIKSSTHACLFIITLTYCWASYLNSNYSSKDLHWPTDKTPNKSACSLLLFIVTICDKHPLSEYYARRPRTNIGLDSKPGGVWNFTLRKVFPSHHSRTRTLALKCLFKSAAFSFVQSFETWLIGQLARQCSEKHREGN